MVRFRVIFHHSPIREQTLATILRFTNCLLLEGVYGKANIRDWRSRRENVLGMRGGTGPRCCFGYQARVDFASNLSQV
jgi:hypothetical protein